MIDDEDIKLKTAYEEIYKKVMDMIITKKYEPQMMAGTLMAQALKMYRITLTDEDYFKMVDAIHQSALSLSPIVDKNKLN